MIKSLKWQLIVSLLVSLAFIYFIISNIKFINGDKFVQIIFFIVMVVSIYNSGVLTQKFIQSKEK
ncbi:hypothetical protein [Rummeliibacillus pycnus]|uniref:hypothetical protein n=1 Tax=Rummeliibacillus pycnus TaxID=101070 RepID=UPI000C99E03E|nr:hypothetical protein [Rummeliibacillus pycnus]